MTAERLINALKQCNKDAPVHVQLDGCDYGVVAGLTGRSKLFICTQFEITKTVPKEVITGEPEAPPVPEKEDSGNKAKDKQ